MKSTKKNTAGSSKKQPKPVVRFNTLEELFDNPFFNKSLKASIDLFDAGRPILELKHKYKRTPVDYLKENNLFTAPALKAEYIQIERKQSKLSASVRSAIVYFVGKAINKTLKHYAEKEKRAAAKAGK